MRGVGAVAGVAGEAERLYEEPLRQSLAAVTVVLIERRPTGELGRAATAENSSPPTAAV
jgi:hypothetical protein